MLISRYRVYIFQFFYQDSLKQLKIVGLHRSAIVKDFALIKTTQHFKTAKSSRAKLLGKDYEGTADVQNYAGI